MSDEDESGAGAEIAAQLAEIPLEDLQRLRSQGHGPTGLSYRQIAKLKGDSAGGEERRRANKNRPMEMSSKKPVPRFREVIQAPKPVVRDPRFESLCGEFDEDRFKKSYGFLYGEAMPKEAAVLKKALKKEKDQGRKSELKQRLSEIEGQVKGEQQRRKLAEREAEAKQEQKELVEQGQAPYFVSKPKRKREQLIEMYKELKAHGKLEAFLAKRRKKNATKEHTKIPTMRR